MIQKVGIVVKENLEDALELSREIKEYLESKGIETCYDESSAKNLKLKNGRSLNKMDVDLIIILGGDGTMLWVESEISGKHIPLFGMNFGSTGFLTEILPGEWKASIDKILNGDYSIDERRKLEVKVNGEVVGYALNEVVVKAAMPVKMLKLEVLIDEQIAEIARSDGVIISTPTGSTAYSMSAGGPIVDPRVSAFIVTSICPFKLGARSLVVPEDSKVRVRVATPKNEAVIVVDGEFKKRLGENDEITVEFSEHKSYLLKLEKDFYERIRERLGT